MFRLFVAIATLVGGACASHVDLPEPRKIRFLSEAPNDPRSGPPGFHHGIASGDVLPEAIILWSRFTPPKGDDPAESAVYNCVWRISKSAKLKGSVSEGTTSTSAARDYTLKIDAPIKAVYSTAKAGTRLYYGFACEDQAGIGYASTVGTFRTIPVATRALSTLTWGLASCSNYGFGAFNAYDALARTSGLDFWIHVGDYQYEYANGTYPDPSEQERQVLPVTETILLNDYRTRYALYKKDPALRKLHQRAPLISIWDDHEFANDAYIHGAENHDPNTEGNWDTRVRMAAQAYFEWMPIREPVNGAYDITRKFEFGTLATLVMIETRVTGRTKQEPNPTPTLSDLVQRDYKTWDDAAIETAKDSFLESINSPADKQMTDAGVEFLSNAFGASTAAGKPWQVLGNQVIMGTQNGADLIGAAAVNPAYAGLLPYVVNVPFARELMAGGKYRFPWNVDSWDGYNFQREQLLDKFADFNNVIVLSGDSHNGWVNRLATDRGAGPVTGTEFAGMSVTSPGFEGFGAAFVPFVTDAFRLSNPNLVYNDMSQRGVIVFQAGSHKLHAEFLFVSTTTPGEPYTAACGKAFDVPAAAPGDIRDGECGQIKYTANRKRLGLLGASADALIKELK